MEPSISRADLRQGWRACLLSGGASRRMGRDKALLPHPEGGCWLERTLGLLGELELPITLLSRHREHLARAEALAERSGLRIQAIEEPPPWEGPLRALERLMALHPRSRLLLCPVDLPHLTRAALETLRAAADDAAGAANGAPGLLLAHDGERLQPLLGIYPSSTELHRDLATCLAGGERRLQRWLARHPHRTVRLEAAALCNVNHPHEFPPPQDGDLPSLPP
jgi:molybdopterin-guanine dinucleotide biosynthesis protein A